MADRNLTLLIDAASLIYRALFAIPDTVSTKEGKPINAAWGFLDMTARLVSDHDPAFLACADDTDWRPEWRVELLPAYKSMRAEEGSAQEAAEERLEPQLPILFEILERLDIKLVGYPGYEAEDVIGSLVPRAPGEVAIVSGDRDLFQLVHDPDVYVLFPRRGVSQLDKVDETYIATKYGIPGRAYKDFAVLRGDPSDGLPGVRGIGEKLAAALISRYGSLDAVIEAAQGSGEGAALGKVRRDLDYVKRASKVVAIPTDLPLPDVDLTRPRIEPDDDLIEFATRSGLGGPVKRLAAALAKT
ncbi:MAG: 5'-3' exonuclease [Actinomycetota bacterium]|nr:5'-3' exonuclease [Actinomycetota bacterium]